VQTPHIPIYYGGDTPKTFSRIVNYTDGWIFGIVPSIPKPFEYLENGMRRLKEEARRSNKDPDKLSTFAVAFPHIIPRHYYLPTLILKYAIADVLQNKMQSKSKSKIVTFNKNMWNGLVRWIK
jgi:hypothetical protein